ncbi:MAG: type II toxin-antitoxin system VapC family toxin [Rhizobiaceae bacterium]
MRVIDTSIWIEIYRGSELGRRRLPLLSAPDAIVVPTLVQYEIFKWLSRERAAEDATLAITFTSECLVQDLTIDIAILAAELSAIHKLHASDAIIFATAQFHKAALVTCDAHFKDLPGVEFFEK